MTSEAASKQRRRIGRYEVVAEIGRGGMGVVYRAEDRMIGRDVAIKTLTEVTPELKERFYVEARSGILSHPNIVTVYELGEDDGTPFIAMEFLAGESLERLLQAVKRIPLSQALLITEQLCAGLGYAHQHGLVHRDVKPANTMVLPDGRVKLVDFGIARLADQATRLTRADALLGTFHYIAPERLKGEASDGRADIWSVGVMLYEMVTGELPFRGKDVSALYRVMHEPYVPLRELNEQVPETLTSILDRALAKDVAARYSTTEEMQGDLQKVREELKQGHVDELLDSARRLLQERRLANARTVVLQVQRIDAGNIEARVLLQQIQEELNQLQRGDRLRQTLDQAEEALAERRLEEALGLYAQAAKLDEEGMFSIAERVEAVRSAQEQDRRVRSLTEQAGEARGRGDLTRAQALLGEALGIDERSTELRQAHALLLREIQRRAEAAKVELLLQGAREEIGGRRYTAALAQLREAAEVDPTHEEVQQLLLSTTARQKEERRRQVLEQIVGEIQESLHADNLARARDFVTRALETLPTETVLLRLKAEVDERERNLEVEALVRTTLLEAQELWDKQPEEAMARVDTALAKAPGEARLLQFRLRLEEHHTQRKKEERQGARLTQARQWMEEGRPGDAVIELESAAVESGETEEVAALLALAREQQTARQKRRALELRVEEIQQLMRDGRYAEVLERLRDDSEAPELDGLRAKASRRLREIEERVAAVTERATAAAEVDLKGAMRLLGEQPDEVKHSEAVVTLCAELTRREAKEQAISAALERSDALLRKGDFAGSEKPMSKLGEAYGPADPRMLLVMSEFASRRRTAADTELQGVMHRTHDALHRGAAKEAERELGRGRVAAGFASDAVREELRRLEVRTTAERGQTHTGARTRTGMPSVLAGVRRWGLVAAVLAGLGGGAATLHSRHAAQDRMKADAPPTPQGVATPAAAQAPVDRSTAAEAAPAKGAEQGTEQPTAASAAGVGKTYIEFEASPWATVVAVTDEQGKPVELSGGAMDAATPLRLDGLAVGNYRVTLRSPTGETREVQCRVSGTEHMCTTEFAAPDVTRLLKGDRP